MPTPTPTPTPTSTAASEPKKAVDLKVKDRVYYIPDLLHALNRNLLGDYPWVIGLRKMRQQPDGRAAEVVEELSPRQTYEFLEEMKRSPNAEEAKKKMVFIRPCAAWPAIVTAVNSDGTVDLDIRPNNSGVTLHYEAISQDQLKEAPGTCHMPEAHLDEHEYTWKQLTAGASYKKTEQESQSTPVSAPTPTTPASAPKAK